MYQTIKDARIFAAAVWIDCPTCKEGIVYPETGSYMWDVADINGTQIITCNCCGQMVRVLQPKVVRVRK